MALCDRRKLDLDAYLLRHCAARRGARHRCIQSGPSDGSQRVHRPCGAGRIWISQSRITAIPPIIGAMRILVVEDEKKVASFIKKGLQQEGHAADTVHDGDEATHHALSFDYDLVVLDLMLPKRTGLDVLRAIRKQKPKLPVLVLTAKGSVEDKVTGLDAGA